MKAKRKGGKVIKKAEKAGDTVAVFPLPARVCEFACSLMIDWRTCLALFCNCMRSVVPGLSVNTLPLQCVDPSFQPHAQMADPPVTG